MNNNPIKPGATIIIHHNQPNAYTLEELFEDSLHIGTKGLYKVQLKQYRHAGDVSVKIELSERQKNSWIKKQALKFDKDGITSSDAEIADFNNDELGDLTFQSAAAARGANEIRTLLIFDKVSGMFIPIKNSESYPNLRYNKKLDCIDALLVSGCWVTVFLHLRKDSLSEFADVNVCGDSVSVAVRDMHGIRKYLIKNKKNTFGDFPRFENFRPLKKLDEKP